jgi:hypothetical protein
LTRRRDAVLARRGKGGRQREVGIDDRAWEQLRPWLTARAELPVGPLFCIINGPTRGRHWSNADAVEMAREGVPLIMIPAPARPPQSRDHIRLSARHRQRRDHRDRSRTSSADGPGEHDVRRLPRPSLTATRDNPSCLEALDPMRA